jgi:flavorubredoxin
MGSGSWAPRSGALMREEIEQLKHMEILDDEMTVTSSLQPQNESEIDALADAIAASVLK